MGETSGNEIRAYNMAARVVHVSKGLEGVRNKWKDASVLVECEAIESMEPASLPIHFAYCLRLAKRRGEVSRESVEWRPWQYWIDQILLDTLRIEKKEQLVFDDWTAKAATKLISLKRIGGSAGQCGIQTLVAEIVEPFAMQAVRARFGSHVD